MFWISLIEYLKMLHQQKMNQLIIDYRVTNIDWIENRIDLVIQPVTSIEFIKIDKLLIC